MLFIIFFSFYSINIYAQIGVDNIVLSAEVKCIDSQYVFIPHLKILDNDTIQIHKSLYYGNEAESLADCKFFLQKLVGRHYENIYIFSLREPLFDMGLLEFRNFTRKDSLSDSVNLQYFIPLDVNEYRFSIDLKYYSKDGMRTINSKWILFNVYFKPKGSIYD